MEFKELDETFTSVVTNGANHSNLSYYILEILKHPKLYVEKNTILEIFANEENSMCITMYVPQKEFYWPAATTEFDKKLLLEFEESIGFFLNENMNGCLKVTRVKVVKKDYLRVYLTKK